MKRSMLALLLLFVLFCASVLLVNAQRTDLSTANVPSHPDCPITLHCAPTPISKPGGGGAHSGDEDGDGVPDGIDQCPNQSGPASNHGCPLATPIPATAAPTHPPLTVLPPRWCYVTPLDGEAVNIHESPSVDSPVVALLQPDTFLPVQGTYQAYTGFWILTNKGWVSSQVVIMGGACNANGIFHLSNSSSTAMVLLIPPPSAQFTIQNVSAPSSDTSNGTCSNAFDLALKTSDGLSKTIHFSFGDGSVHFATAQRCIKLDSDGQGFVISPTADDTTDIPIHWYLGEQGSALTLLAFLQPGAHSASPTPGLIFSWQLLPPGPCRSTDQACQTQQTLDFSLSLDHSTDPANPGTFFNWKFLPPGPCRSSDQSCSAEGGGTHSLLADFTSATPNITYFADGIGGAAQGMSLISTDTQSIIFVGGAPANGSTHGIIIIGGHPGDPSFQSFGIQGVQGVAAADEIDLELPAVQ